MALLCNYYLTYECNMKCSFCDIWKRSKPNSLQSLSDIEGNLDGLKKLGVKFVDFTGGEPLLYPQVIGALQAAKERNFFTTLTTNGLLYPKFAAGLKGKVDMLRISMHSKKAVGNALKAAKDERQKLFLHFVVTNENVSEIDSVCRFAAKNRVPVRLAPCFSYFGNPALSRENLGFIRSSLKRPYTYADLSELELAENGGNSVEKPVCRAVSNVVTVSPGNRLLLPCYHMARESVEINNGIVSAYSSQKAKAFREREGRFSFCEGCNVYCYMRASFPKNPFSKLFWLRLASLGKFGFEWFKSQKA